MELTVCDGWSSYGIPDPLGMLVIGLIVLGFAIAYWWARKAEK
jgi:hypothetical protein